MAATPFEGPKNNQVIESLTPCQGRMVVSILKLINPFYCSGPRGGSLVIIFYYVSPGVLDGCHTIYRTTKHPGHPGLGCEQEDDSSEYFKLF